MESAGVRSGQLAERVAVTLAAEARISRVQPLVRRSPAQHCRALAVVVERCGRVASVRVEQCFARAAPETAALVRWRHRLLAVRILRLDCGAAVQPLPIHQPREHVLIVCAASDFSPVLWTAAVCDRSAAG